MTLKEYVDNFVKLIEENPDLADAQVIYAADDEGNTYHPLECSAMIGYVDEMSYYIEGIFFEEDLDDDEIKDYIKVVCVN